MLGSSQCAATVAVRDLAAARRFYQDTLGLKMGPELGPDTFACEAGNGSMILVYQRPNHEPSAATILSFQVDDLDAQLADLGGRGVMFEDYDIPGVKTENHVAALPDGGKVAWFTDPDGNIISLAQM
jgi:catechol 2,3-dioxygenase-like lactoylglutathione lyase family enzyme